MSDFPALCLLKQALTMDYVVLAGLQLVAILLTLATGVLVLIGTYYTATHSLFCFFPHSYAKIVSVTSFLYERFCRVTSASPEHKAQHTNYISATDTAS